MTIEKLEEFASNGDKHLTGLDVATGFPRADKPERPWFNKLFGDITRKINEVVDSIKGLESIADLSTIQNPKDGLRVYVKSYHVGKNIGGGYFTYDSSKVAINDGGAIIDGWARDYIPDSMPLELWGAKGDGDSDDSMALKSALEYARINRGTVIGRAKLGYAISDLINVYSSIDIDRLKFPTDASGIVGAALLIESDGEKIEIPREGITGLTEGSYKVDGLPQDSEGKYFSVLSQEVLSPRELYSQSRTAYKGDNGNWWFTGDTESGAVEVDTGLSITDKEARNGAWLRRGTKEENKLYIGDRATSIPYLDSNGNEIYSLPFEKPYLKNTVFKNIGAGLISPSLDMSFYDDETYTIYQMPEDEPIEIKIGYIDIIGTPSLISRRAILNKRSNVTFKISKVNNLARFTMLLSSEEGSNLTIDGGTYGGTRKDTLGYMVSIAYGCDVYVRNFRTTNNGRRSFDGRHVSNLFFDNCSGFDLFTHWANNIVINNCEFKAVGSSGRTIKIYNSVIHEGVKKNEDSCYTSGELIISNCKVTHALAENANGMLLFARKSYARDYWGSPRKTFDIIKLDNVDIYLTASTANIANYALFNLGNSTNVKIELPELISVRNVNLFSNTVNTRYRLFEYTRITNNSVISSNQSVFSFENIKSYGVNSQNGYIEIPPLFAYDAIEALPLDIEFTNCNINRLYVDGFNFVNSCSFTRCSVGSLAFTGGPSATKKPMQFNNCNLNNSSFFYPGDTAVTYSHFSGEIKQHVVHTPIWSVAYNTYEPDTIIPISLETAEGTIVNVKKH